MKTDQAPSRSISSLRPQVELARRLNLFDATMIIVGNIIGVGIFTTTGFIAEALPNPRMILLVWFLGGLLTLCGALTYAELGAALPRAGGEYVYLKEAYGPFWGFLNGWTYFVVSNPGSIAAMSIGVISYLEHFFPVISLGKILLQLPGFTAGPSVSSGQLVAIVIVILFSAINYFGVRFGSLVQNILTVIKLGTVFSIAVLGVIIGKGNWDHFAATASPATQEGIVSDLSLGMIAVFFAYTGWFASTYVASEIKDPQRNVPYSIIYGTLTVMLAYVLINVAYVYALPVERMKGMINVGEAASLTLFGGFTSVFVSWAIIICILGAINSVILTAPRIYFAMARDGLFFRSAAEIHPKFKTPSNSILLQAIWSCLLVVSGTFGQLLTYTVVAMLTFSIMTGLATFLLRIKRPELPRPYKTPGFPWVPAVFVVCYVLILINIVISRPKEGLLGLGIVALGVPVYFYWKRMLR